jgi:hypothetical protein
MVPKFTRQGFRLLEMSMTSNVISRILFYLFIYFFSFVLIFLRFKSIVRVMYLIPKIFFGIDFGALNCTCVISCFIDSGILHCVFTCSSLLIQL